MSWLQSGRPLSFAALEALVGVTKDAKEGRLHLHMPVQGLPSPEEVENCLRSYQVADSAQSVQNLINVILQNYTFLGPQGK